MSEALHRAAGKGAAAGFKTHAGQDGQAGVFPGGQQRGLELVQVGEGLKKDQVGPGRRTGPHDAGVFLHGILKGQSAVGFQQLAQRADIQRGKRTIGRTGPLAVGNARRNDLFQTVGAARQLVGRRAKGVGVDDAAARCGILRMDTILISLK